MVNSWNSRLRPQSHKSTARGAMVGVTEELPFSGRRFPLVIQPKAAFDMDLAAFVASKTNELERKLREHGALLFRGFQVANVEDFDAVIEPLCERRAPYMYRSTPRSSVARGIYTATEYPPDREIPLHNENAYQRSWPLKLAFCCLTPATTGGETPLADMRDVGTAIGAKVLDDFEARGVRYTRHYYPFVDLPWQVVFQTDDREAVRRYCDQNEIDCEWLEADVLRTVQTCQGTAIHPLTKERIFFNQCHLFHISSLGADEAYEMQEVYGNSLPRHACYGDGSQIDADVLAVVGDAFRTAAVSLPWQRGDVMLLDNMQIAHGRRPFTGERKVLAALLDLYPE